MDSAKLIDQLAHEEALRGKPYFDCGHSALLTCPVCVEKKVARAGILTIGIGRNLRDEGINREEMFHLANNDIERVSVALDEHLPWWRNLDEVRQRVLADMTFNMGIHALLNFKHMLASAQIGAFERAAAEMQNSAWDGQVGPRAKHLERMMRTGVE